MDRLKGKVAIVSGGATGCGAAAVRLFAAEGAAVGIIDRNAKDGQALAFELATQGKRVVFATADVSQKDQVEAAVAVIKGQLGPVNVLFNHAGTIVIKPFLETEEADWDFLFDVNVKSMYLMTRAVLPMMLEAGKGSIVCTSSIALAIAVEFRDKGIRCNAVCPGFIETPHGNREVAELSALGVDVSEAAIKAAQGRMGKPEDIARAALYLASDDAEFVNGTQLFVDNGFSAV
jgi:NAD(P)-dependent dehydrogenase (short-subunit alcohol dehydrogenase family)